MTTPFYPLLAALLLASTAHVFAQPDTATPQRIEITASPEAVAARVVIERRESDQRFELPNGREVSVDSYGETLRMRYRNRNLTVRHDGKGAFVSSEGRVQLAFQLNDAGDPRTLRAPMPADW